MFDFTYYFSLIKTQDLYPNPMKLIFVGFEIPHTFESIGYRLVPDMTLTLKKTTLTLKMGGSVHLP